METLVDEGLVAAIGLSDIDVEGTRRIVDTARIKPAVVEVESHPYHPQWELHEYCATRRHHPAGIRAAGRMHWNRDCSTTRSSSTIAAACGKTPAQVLLAWGIQRGTAVLTSSVNAGRIRRELRRLCASRGGIQEISDISRLAAGSIRLSTRANRDLSRCPRAVEKWWSAAIRRQTLPLVEVAADHCYRYALRAPSGNPSGSGLGINTNSADRPPGVLSGPAPKARYR